VELKSFAEMDCSVAQCLEVVGDRWSLLIVREAFLGTSRFDVFQRRLGISRNILNQRLSKLVDQGVLVRRAYSERPTRYEYKLTDKGRDLWPVITTMRQWGDRYAAPEGPPVEIVDTRCGHVAQVEMYCSACHHEIGPRDVRVVNRRDASASASTP
jgi:DNA-binding HxlR family transcriptional regulator